MSSSSSDKTDVRFEIQHSWIILERTPVLSDGISLVTSFIEVFPAFHVLLQPLTNGTDIDIIMQKSRKTDAIKPMELSTDKIEQLIELVREEPCLYDVTLAGHSDH